jgi:hypothetical protein
MKSPVPSGNYTWAAEKNGINYERDVSSWFHSGRIPLVFQSAEAANPATYRKKFPLFHRKILQIPESTANSA